MSDPDETFGLTRTPVRGIPVTESIELRWSADQPEGNNHSEWPGGIDPVVWYPTGGSAGAFLGENLNLAQEGRRQDSIQFQR